ncbi:MAG TPA: methyltransferase [Anaerolineae bacterium]|nr:methyltransferase [Anaerolineae bacterium]
MSLVPGTDIFLKRSGLSSPANSLLLTLVIAGVALAAREFFQVFDGLFVGSTLISQGIVMWLGLVIVAQMIVRRDSLKARWDERAFSIAFRWCAIPGLTLVAMGIAHFAWIEGARILPREIALIPFVYLLVTGIVLWLRALMVFGMDNLSLMYVYFSSESRLVNSNVYGVLRHPIYSAVIRIAFALILWNGSGFALFAGVFVPLSMTAWLRWVEEPELIERFGESYRAYRARVPAFFNLNPQTWPVLWRFLVTGK